LGKAGEFALMSEFLCRGWNVATPEVDVGDDVFVVRDSDGQLRRVQVKTANARLRKNQSISVQYNISLNQLKTLISPELIYAFSIRHAHQWLAFVLIDRQTLRELVEIQQIGSITGNNVVLTFLYNKDYLLCGSQNLSAYLNNFDKFPIISH
jgi:hypothetical protein